METWTRWPYVTATSELLVLVERHPGALHLPVVTREPGLMLHPGRRGISYLLAPHEACWRSFGEILAPDVRFPPSPLYQLNQLIDEAQLLRFVRHYGPLFVIDGNSEPFTETMAMMAVILRELALHWDRPESPKELSRRLPDTEVPVTSREQIFSANVYLTHSADLGQPPSLLRFMFKSALRHIQQDMPMTRCRACGMWIALTRSDRQFCDGACRQAKNVGKAMRGRRQSVGGN
jgi:hypothetical protein